MQITAEERDGAIVTAAVAAATAAAAYALKRALADREDSVSGRDDDVLVERHDGGASPLGQIDTFWEFASHALLPMAEDAAESAGKWLAANAPAVIRDRLMRRFVEAFNENVPAG